MICNDAGPLSLGSTTRSSGSAHSHLEDFLNQFLSKNESKFHSIQQTLHKAETQCSTPQMKTEKALNFRDAALDNSHDSLIRFSNQTTNTQESGSKTSHESSVLPKVALTMTDILDEDPPKKTPHSNVDIGSRNKSRTFERAKTDRSHLSHSKSKRNLMPAGFLSPFRTKSPRSSHSTNSFAIESHTYSSQFQSPKFDSDEEDMEGFLMIKPIKIGTPHHKHRQPAKSQNFSLNLDETLFPREIIDYAKSLQEANFGAYVRTLLEFIYSYRNRNPFFSAKRPISEALYSIHFEGESLEMFKKLLDQVLIKLKEESITLKQKYRMELEYIETKHTKIWRNTAHSIKFEEKELQKLQAKISIILQERCLMDSLSALHHIHHFLDKILEKFPSINRPSSLKLAKNISVDNITLPKLLEKLVESPKISSSPQFKTVTLYTYDLYTTAQNLLVYMILRYFDPEPLMMTASELRYYRQEVMKASKLHILHLIQFWISERKGDFMRVSDIITILSTFLDLIQPIETDPEISAVLKDLKETHEHLCQEAFAYKQKICMNVDKQITPHSHANSFTHSNGKPDISLVSRVIATSDGVSPFFAKDNVPVVKQSPYNTDVKIKTLLQEFPAPPSLTKNESTPEFHAGFRFFNSNPPQTPSKGVFRSGGFTGHTKNKEAYNYKMLLEEDSGLLAKYFTMIDWKYFAKIDISEMISKRWTKQNKTECPKYWKYVRRFNSLCSWIQYVVLLHESLRRRMEIVAKLLDVALICLKTYGNYSTSHYIFAALSSLQKFGVISLQENLAANFEELKKIFLPAENFLVTFRDIFGAMKNPAIPMLNFYLQSFLKLQDGVVFWAKLPESNQLRYLKFPLLVQIQDSCKEMRRFQKSGYEKIRISAEDPLYKFLKKGFKKGIKWRLEDRDESLSELIKMVGQVKEKQRKLVNFFGVNTVS